MLLRVYSHIEAFAEEVPAGHGAVNHATTLVLQLAFATTTANSTDFAIATAAQGLKGIAWASYDRIQTCRTTQRIAFAADWTPISWPGSSSVSGCWLWIRGSAR